MISKTQRRQNAIMEKLATEVECSVPELVKFTGTSEATIRRDLLEMEKLGLLLRTIGGARLVEGQSLLLRTFEERSNRAHAAKEAIAATAAALVKPGMTIFIDSGTTCWLFATALKSHVPLRIVTNALAPIEMLGGTPGVEINLVGGCFRGENLDFIGPLALESLQSFHADMAFMGCDSLIPGRGVYALDVNSALLGRSVARYADQLVILCDRSKINAPGCHRLYTPQDIDMVITDGPVEILKEEPFQVIYPK